MQQILEQIVKELIPNSAIQFFTKLPYDGTYKRTCNIEIPILNDLLVRESLMETAVKSYAALKTIDYRLELYALCDLVQKKFDLSDKDTLERVHRLLAFEIADEGDLKFINEYRKEIRDLTLSKLEKNNLQYLFPYYFIKNRTGKELDLSLVPTKEYESLLSFIDSEKNEPELNQIDSKVTIKKL